MCWERLSVNEHKVNQFYCITLMQRSYVCSIDGCNASYRRKDHLTRHLLHHQGTMFKCPIESCCREFAYLSCVTRHLKECHEGEAPPEECQKQFVCPEDGCGKVFRYASRLQKHEGSHGLFLILSL